ncbi:hypothetical protein [Nannocystis pusilla]|uniref:hypothetical protein n=1 Tax=Nannocystis pusilla TaxID=889268 RepID=UPI003B8272D6
MNITDETARNDFEHNLAVALARDYVDRDTMPYAPWIVKKYREATTKREELNEYRPEEIGDDSVTMRLTVTFKKPGLQGYYGLQDLYVFRDEVGRTVKLFARSDGEGPEVGETIELVAELRKKDEYKGRKQTTIKKISRGWLRVDPAEPHERVALRARARELLHHKRVKGAWRGPTDRPRGQRPDLAEWVVKAEQDYQKRKAEEAGA